MPECALQDGIGRAAQTRRATRNLVVVDAGEESARTQVVSVETDVLSRVSRLLTQLLRRANEHGGIESGRATEHL